MVRGTEQPEPMSISIRQSPCLRVLSFRLSFIAQFCQQKSKNSVSLAFFFLYFLGSALFALFEFLSLVATVVCCCMWRLLCSVSIVMGGANFDFFRAITLVSCIQRGTAVASKLKKLR